MYKLFRGIDMMVTDIKLAYVNVVKVVMSHFERGFSKVQI